MVNLLRVYLFNLVIWLFLIFKLIRVLVKLYICCLVSFVSLLFFIIRYFKCLLFLNWNFGIFLILVLFNFRIFRLVSFLIVFYMVVLLRIVLVRINCFKLFSFWMFFLFNISMFVLLGIFVFFLWIFNFCSFGVFKNVFFFYGLEVIIRSI